MSRNYYDNKIIFLIETTIIIIVNETTTQISAIWRMSLSSLTENNAVNKSCMSRHYAGEDGGGAATVLILIADIVKTQLYFIATAVIAVIIITSPS